MASCYLPFSEVDLFSYLSLSSPKRDINHCRCFQNLSWLMTTRDGLYFHRFQFTNEALQHLKGRKSLFCMTQTNQTNLEKFIIAFGTFKCPSRWFERIFPAASSTVLACFVNGFSYSCSYPSRLWDSVSSKGTVDKVRTFSKSKKECSNSLGNGRDP